MNRDIPYSQSRLIDEETLKDLLVIHIEQTNSAAAISDAMNIEYSTPFSESLYDIILDALGAPNEQEFREPFYTLLYGQYLLENEFDNVDDFFRRLRFEMSDHLHMYNKDMQST